MSNDNGNPNIAKYGKMTRFTVGGNNCPLDAQRKASKPWEIKKTVRMIMAATLPSEATEITEEWLINVVCPHNQKITSAQLIAIRMVIMAMNDYRAMDKLIMMVDGPRN